MTRRRTYGVKGAAGVSVTEEEVRGPIQAGRFGTSVLVGVYERGPVMEPIVMVGPKQMKRKVGGRMLGTIAPDGVEDFWDHSDGAGTLVAVRLTDGNERKAGLQVMSRHTGVAQHVASPLKAAAEEEVVPVLTISAKNGGRWAGRKQFNFWNDLTIAGNITETTVDTGETLLEDELVGGHVRLDGTHPDAAKLYEITGNTTAGVITVRPGSTMLADAQGDPAQTEVDVYITLPEVSMGTNRLKGVAVQFTEGALDPALEFGLKVFVDGVKVHEWESLSMDPLSPRYAETVINDDDANEEIEVTDMLQTGIEITEFTRPGNFVRMVSSITATDITFQNVVVKQNDDTTNIHPVSAVAPGDEHLVPGVLEFQWDDTAKEWVVTFTSGQETARFEDLPVFHSGGGAAYSEVWTSPTPYLPNITIDHDADPADEAKLVFEILPVMTDMIGGSVYPDVDGAQMTGFAIRSVDNDTLTVESGDPSSVGSVGAAGTVTGSVDVAAGVEISAANNQFIMAVDGRSETAIDIVNGLGKTPETIRDEINAILAAKFGVGYVAAYVEVDGAAKYLRFTSPGGFDGAGPGSSIKLKSTGAVHDAFYALFGFTVGAGPAEASWYGTSGTRARVEFLQPLTGGYDGLAPDLADYLAAFALDASNPMSQLREAGYGQFMVSVPGLAENDDLSSADIIAIHKQGERYCESMPHAYFGETPLDKVDEVDIFNYWNDDVGRSDMGITYLPSFGDRPDPDAPLKLKRVSNMPSVMGHWAKKAVTNEGYHRPAAGPDVALHKLTKLPDGHTSYNENFLNPGGFNVIKKRRGSFVVWGARTMYENSTWRQATVRMQFNHYVWVFIDNYDWVIFALNDEDTWGLIEASAVEYLDLEAAKRVLRAPAGGKAYLVKVDADNNPQSEIDEGIAHLDIKLWFTKFIEQLAISIGAGGITESA